MSTHSTSTHPGSRFDIAEGPSIRCRADLVVLAGAADAEVRWTRGTPRAALPLPGGTVFGAMLGRLGASIDGAPILCIRGSNASLETIARSRQHLRQPVTLVRDDIPRGAAGCLKACEDLGSHETFIVVSASAWIEDSPSWMLDAHRAAGNALTAFYAPGTGPRGTRDGAAYRPMTVFCVERSALAHVRPHGYQDLKEQLVPTLKSAGKRVGAVALTRPAFDVSDWSCYLNVLSRVVSDGHFPTAGYRRLAPDIWVGESSRLAPGSRVVGPVVLGAGCRVDDGAVVIGPAMLGDNSHIGRGSWVIRTVSSGPMKVSPGTSTVDEFVPVPMANRARF